MNNRVKVIFRAVILAVVLALLILQAGCFANTPASTDVTHSQKPTHVITPAPTATSEPDTLSDKLCNVFRDAYRAELVLLNNWTMEYGYSDVSYVINNLKRYTLKEQLLKNKLLPEAVEEVKTAASELTGKTITLDSSGLIQNAPDWKYLAAVLPSIPNEAAWFAAMRFEVTATESTDAVDIVISMSPKSICEFANEQAMLADTYELEANTYLNIRFTYAYLTAIYDENANEDIRGEFQYNDEYADTLIFPLESLRPSFHDTWAQGRSNNTRKHMGTDIKADEGTEIISCCDGTVLYVGSDEIPGNYVIIADKLGYEYHYYHMVELSRSVSMGDIVKRGDVIGLVGNTGNSDANHLHIAIINPDGIFENPYSLMLELESR